MLPFVNALLNAGSALCLVAGYVFIRQRRVAAHRAAMLSAFTLSTLFLILGEAPRARGRTAAAAVSWAEGDPDYLPLAQRR